MQVIKENTSTTDRDPNIYLGIDGTGIHKDRFLYNNIKLYECGFYAFQNCNLKETELLLGYNNEYFHIITNNPNIYITEDDLKIPLKHYRTSSCDDHEDFKHLSGLRFEIFEIIIPKECKTVEEIENLLDQEEKWKNSIVPRYDYKIGITDKELWEKICYDMIEEKDQLYFLNKVTHYRNPFYGTFIKNYETKRKL